MPKRKAWTEALRHENNPMSCICRLCFLGTVILASQPSSPRALICNTLPAVRWDCGGLTSILTLSFCLILKRADGPCSPHRMLWLSPGPHQGSQPRVQRLALLPGHFLDVLEFPSKANVWGHMTRILEWEEQPWYKSCQAVGRRTKEDHTGECPKEGRCRLLSALWYPKW